MSLFAAQGCWEHDGGTLVTLEAENAPPPYVWSCNEFTGGPTTNAALFVGASSMWPDFTALVSVRSEDGLHSNLVMGTSAVVSLGHCAPSATNILPITALPGYDAMTNHAPRLDPRTVPNGGNCPDADILDVYAGWKHGGEKPWERDFETIPTGKPADDLTSHCYALDWVQGQEINLEEYLPELLAPFKDNFSYRVNNEDIEDSTITVGKKPKELLPTIYHVEILNDADTTLDRLWIVVLNPDTRSKFNAWVSENATNAAWLANLPPPPDRLIINGGDATLPASASANWNAPEPFPPNNYMHPKAVYELRSKPIAGGHGHQATYDGSGNLIIESIKAGTADFASPSKKYMLMRLDDHRVTDVKPYIQALQLDGNPVFSIDSSGNISTFWTRNLYRPPLRVGPFTRQYLQRRPTTPTGVLGIP